MDIFLPTHQTPGLVLFNIVILLLLFFTLKEALEPPHMVSLAKYRFALFLCVIFCVFSFWGTDWFHYLERFPMLQSGEKGHMESIYVWIAQNLSPNYLFFRLIIWGSSFIIYLKIIERLEISVDLALLFFGSVSILWFSYARVSLAIALVYWGGLLILKTERNVFSVVCGFAILFSSIYFHKSAMFAVVIFFVVCAFYANVRWGMWLTILLFPVLIIYARSLISQLMLSEIDSSENMISEYLISGQNYMTYEAILSGWGSIIARVLERTPYYILAYLGLKVISSEFYYEIPSNVKFFIIFQFLIVIFSSIFLFDLNSNTEAFYGRFMRFNAIPTSIVWAYLYESGFYEKITKIIFYIAVGGAAYEVLYSFYCILS